MGFHPWSDGHFQVEIEELESKAEGKKPRPFRIRIEGFDIDTSIMTLRPDQWSSGVASRWTELLDKAVKGTIKPHLHLRGADDYNTFRKSQAVGSLIHEATVQTRFSTLFVMLTNFQVTINLILVPICLIPD